LKKVELFQFTLVSDLLLHQMIYFIIIKSPDEVDFCVNAILELPDVENKSNVGSKAMYNS
jgi:hypothetical protein